MKHLEEYRSPELSRALISQIERVLTRPWTLMEVCGGQTHSIVKHGLEQLLPASLRLIHGPGCPVCVTPIELIDAAIQLASKPNTTLCTFGDMLRVPGSVQSLQQARTSGATIKLVYSPLDAIKLAESNPDGQIVFFGVGFETTAPATALAAKLARTRKLTNFSILASHVLVPPALTSLLSSPDHEIDGLLAAGHVCTVMGLKQYEPIAARFKIPIVATGFEPVDILQGILMCVTQLEEGRTVVENQYQRAVADAGNLQASQLIDEVFETTDLNWRGIGPIPQSGLQLNKTYRAWDASLHLALRPPPKPAFTECEAGLILLGKKRPTQCPAFGSRCRPEHPLGAPMVSSEGACAAYYRYGEPA